MNVRECDITNEDIFGIISENVLMKKAKLRKRYLFDEILTYSKNKIIILSGPRQVGKTTFAKSLTKDFSYFPTIYFCEIKLFINIILFLFL